jgi:hypothetical protein
VLLVPPPLLLWDSSETTSILGLGKLVKCNGGDDKLSNVERKLKRREDGMLVRVCVCVCVCVWGGKFACGACVWSCVWSCVWGCAWVCV